MPHTPITTREQLMAAIDHQRCAVVPFLAFESIFEGPQLDEAAREFRLLVFEATGQTHLKYGTSQEDKLLAFCSEHHLSFKMLKHHYLFYRGRVDVESFVNSDL